jgi:hypothetical protein
MNVHERNYLMKVILLVKDLEHTLTFADDSYERTRKAAAGIDDIIRALDDLVDGVGLPHAKP